MSEEFNKAGIDANFSSRIGRRQFNSLLAASIAGTLLLPLSACAGKSAPEKAKPTPEPFNEDTSKKPGELQVIHQPENAALKIRFGKEETIPLLSDIAYFPDAHFAFRRKKNGNVEVWVPGGVSTYYFSGRDFEHLKSGNVDERGNPAPVFGPDPSVGFIQDYAGICSVFQSNSENDLIGFGHGENRPSPGDAGHYLATTFRVESHDSGITWENPEAIIAGKNIDKSHKRISGAGQPCVISVQEPDGKKYFYAYTTKWNATEADAIHLSRAPLEKGGKPGTWEQFTKNKGFVPLVIDKNGNGGSSDAVITPPKFELYGNTVYAALASVSWNKNLGKLVCVFETAIGFCSALSSDGVNWTDYQALLKLPSKDDRGYNRFTYPTLISGSEASDRTTSQTGHIYYAKSEAGAAPHTMLRRPFLIG